ncbi:MAG TPA: FadR/GntR family transcriptional regulator [Clostridium sp.]|uniref:FadR/GntR family transcriptional regulator n=1 Tax=Clostridium sp. TaxID=1506 RepID=UPI002F94B224
MNRFIPQNKESAVDVVINNIKRLLLTKQLLPGDRLPNEMDLAKSLAVSRGSIREAMKILSAFGIVEVKQGDGTYIATSLGTALFDPLLFSFILAEPDLEELAEFRQIMEIEVIKLIIKNADEDALKKIEHAYLEMEQKVKNAEIDPTSLTKSDLNFHAALGNATKNKLIEKTYEFIVKFFEPSIEKTHENQKYGLNALHIHKEILDCLKEKNLDKAIKAIENSVSVWIDLMST